MSDFENKLEKMLKSLSKNIDKIKSKKDAIADLFDSNTVAEADPDDVPVGRSSILNKNKKSTESRCWEGYEPTPGKKAYTKGSCQKKSQKMEKKQGVPEEANPEVHERCVKEVKQKGHSKSSSFAICNAAKAGQKDVKKGEQIVDELLKNLDTISKAYKEKLEKAEKGKEKPFLGYNKEKHSREGGLSEKERNRINREEGSNLKAPVSSKEAKKSPKKAARRKSFCSRMAGVKGATSKKGKLTPKGAALKRWDC